MPDKTYSNLASTFYVANFHREEIIDSDIIIWNKEFQKINPNYVFPAEISPSRTIVHEMGHFFGLHHKFNGTKSVMSYKRKHHKIFEYDAKALRELYAD